MVRARTILLLALVSGLVWFDFGQPLTAHALFLRAKDSFDQRPTRRILMLGNSRTFYHNMPDMLRDMADSAGDPQRYDIVTDLEPGASLEQLWGNIYVKRALREHWSDVIIQPPGSSQRSAEDATSFQDDGARMVAAARATSSFPWLVVGWTYEAQKWDDHDPDGREGRSYDVLLQEGAREFRERTGARLANLGRLWRKVRSEHPEIAMTEDGNHPTLAGSYLYALFMYAELSKRDAGQVTYVPFRLNLKTAAILRAAVVNFELYDPDANSV